MAIKSFTWGAGSELSLVLLERGDAVACVHVNAKETEIARNAA
jgi:hypothetical protein